MSDAISHRGPDGEGFIAVNSQSGIITKLGGEKTPVNLPPLSNFGANANLYLAHRRLSIIDLSTAGHQPMTNTRRNVWITFNGEIYNYKSLKNELSEFNYKSNTDTEVLLYAYEKWGGGGGVLNILTEWGLLSFMMQKKIFSLAQETVLA
jgi:asparagine synthase (glutamine-hydrolysing)